MQYYIESELHKNATQMHPHITLLYTTLVEGSSWLYSQNEIDAIYFKF